MINLVLIFALIVIALFQPIDRVKTALIYAVPIGLFALIYDSLGDNAYYLVAGATSAGAAMLIKKYTERSELRKTLIWLCFSSIFINFFGWGIYHAGMEPTAYNVLLSLLYVAAIIVLMRSSHAGDIKNNSRHPSVRCHAYQSLQHSDQ